MCFSQSNEAGSQIYRSQMSLTLIPYTVMQRINTLLESDHGFNRNGTNTIYNSENVIYAWRGMILDKLIFYSSPDNNDTQTALMWHFRKKKENAIMWAGLCKKDKQGYWSACHVAFQDWCICGALHQNGHWTRAKDTITKHSNSLLQESQCKYFQGSPERCQSQQSHSGSGHTLPTWGSDLWGTSA